MATLIENQYIAKRNKSSFRSNYKSAGFGSGFMNQFTQKPARSKKRGSSSVFASIGQISREKPAKRSPQRAQKREKTHSSGFSFPVPSAATLAVVAGTVIFALAALKWEDLSIKTPEKYIFQSAQEDSVDDTLRYASAGISGLIPEFKIPEEKPASPAAAPAAEEKVSAETVKKPDLAAVAPEKAAKTEESPSSPQDMILTFEWQQHKVKKGEAVSTIAKKYGVSIGSVIASNGITNARKLQEGTVLRIPNIDGIPYTIKKGDNLSKIALSFKVPLEVILDINDIKSDKIIAGETIFIPGARMNDTDLRASMGDLFIYPVQKNGITSYYGMRKDPKSGAMSFHSGIDLRGNLGTPITAALDGTISVVSENWMYGKYIIISHPNGFKTLYGHLNAYSVKQGDKVARGRKIGEVGNTGYSTGPHLHFAIYDKNGKFVDPLKLLN